jgi:hypothetical protein
MSQMMNKKFGKSLRKVENPEQLCHISWEFQVFQTPAIKRGARESPRLEEDGQAII